jgi:DNA-directed RNA polymerase subunit beta'
LKDLINFYDKPNDPLNFSSIKISLASPEKIRSWSFGEVKKPETINYRTFKPERDGLFCAKIFGPVRDFECICGKYKRMKHRGIVCDKCGVEVIHSKVRRERLGHINLATPVAHIWFLKSLPSRIGAILDIALKDVERILYSESYVLLEASDEILADKELKKKIGSVISEDELDEMNRKFQNNTFKTGVGAEALHCLLEKLTYTPVAKEVGEDKRLTREVKVEELADLLRADLEIISSEAGKKKLQRRLKVVEAFNQMDENGEFFAKPEWMMLKVIPVLPPDLRPLVPLEGGRFATSDLNDLYRRVINRNNRLLKLQELSAPEIIVRNEKRMLQESVDALFDNGRRGKIFTGPNKRPLRSLSDMLKGKQGRFRQNLLGKRVDYSGRSVIVVGPDLRLHQCGLPKKMAIELFKPFLYNKLEEHGIVSTIKSAKKLVEKERPEVWDCLEEVTKEHPVLLNRAPTLHRLGIQAFEPVLIEGKAIQLHPLVCFAFNADFDGDQMAVHVPLSVESQMEARVLMMSTNNILSPASGSPVIVPTQDIVLGIYYMTKDDVGGKGGGKIFGSIEDVRAAYDHNQIDLQAPITVRIDGVRWETTAGRIILREVLPDAIDFSAINKTLGKKDLGKLIDDAFHICGPKATVLLADKLRSMGYRYSTKAGLSISIGDMVVAPRKKQMLESAYNEVKKVKEQYSEGLLSDRERYNKVIDVWAKVTDNIADEMFNNIKVMKRDDHKGVTQTVASTNSIYMMADSGARGSAQQIRQLAGMRGLMAKPNGAIIETPITSNFREGLTVLEYFTSTHGARKGLADTALKTASSGYLTRRLVDVAQDSIVGELDCGTKEGIPMAHLRVGVEVKEKLSERVLGRVALDDVNDPVSGVTLVKAGELFTEELCKTIDIGKVEQVMIRSVLTCQSARGNCARCYGRDLATGKLVNVGEAVGVIAAQSIGEPGTQLTMRTFHVGGTFSGKMTQNMIEAKFSGKVKYERIRVVENRDGSAVVVSRNGEVAIVDDGGHVKETYPVLFGSFLKVKEDSIIIAGQTISEWDPFSQPIISEVSGVAKFVDLVDGLSIEQKADELTGINRKTVIDSKSSTNKPAIEVAGKRYVLPVGTIINVDDGADVQRGDFLGKIPREAQKSKDITGGLPRVAELFEARKPKEMSIMAHRSGTVSFAADNKGKRTLVITDDDGLSDKDIKDSDGKAGKDISIPKGKHIIVTEGDYVRKGDALVNGAQNPHEILEVLGRVALSRFLVDEVLDVYRLQGVKINTKHIEVIVRQMLRRVRITEVGDARGFLPGEQVDLTVVEAANVKLVEDGKRPAKFEALLLGITRASLSTDSFISAASFQETTKVLTEASINSRVDKLLGLKENVIMGRLIPAGTGAAAYRGLKSTVVGGKSRSGSEVSDGGREASAR